MNYIFYSELNDYLLCKMVFYGGESYWIAQLLLEKGIGAVYLTAFLIIYFQFRSLNGENGILPVKDFVKDKDFFEVPSVFTFLPDDFYLRIGSILGICLSLSVITGFSRFLGSLYLLFTWIALWFLFLSFVKVGQHFYNHGWDLILVETGFLAIFLVFAGQESSEVLIWLFRWVLFRMMIGSGLIKLRGDSSWRNLTSLNSHFETQPFPNGFSWYLDKLPVSMKKLCVLFSHFVLLIIPLFYFAPQPFAGVAGVLTILYQVMIISSGNYAWLNHITIVLSFSLFSDEFISRFVDMSLGFQESSLHSFEGVIFVLAVFIGFKSFEPVKNLVSSNQVQNVGYGPLNLVNSYGAFQSVPKKRFEIVFEASENIKPSEDDWKRFETKVYPHSVDERPGFIAPYNYRLDYALWFVAHNEELIEEEWFQKIVNSLMDRSKAIDSLFRSFPLKSEEIKCVRVMKLTYRFTNVAERNKTDNYWKIIGEEKLYGSVIRDES